MDTTQQAMKAQLDMHTRWLNNAIKDISEDESLARDDKRLNHIKWVVGHLLNTRLTSISRITGQPVDEAYKDLFARGAALAPDAHYPPLAQLATRWNETAAALAAALAVLPGATLAAASPARLPIDNDTVHGMLAFLLSHEAFHIGQLSILRKMLGKEAMSYG